MTAFDLLAALPASDLAVFLWFFVLLDVPRYVLAVILDPFMPYGGGVAVSPAEVTGIIPCHNEAGVVAACVASMQRNGVLDVVVVDDASTDGTQAAAVAAGALVVAMPRRSGKAAAVNAGLPYAYGGHVLVADADTVFADGAVAAALGYFEPGVGGVGFALRPGNAGATLTARVQAVEYGIGFGPARRLADLLGILSNVSGAAGLFRREAVAGVGGWDIEVAEDAALAMKLRAAGWRLRYAADAEARTMVPETVVALMLQRLRWDTGVVAIWWRKNGWMLNPLSPRFRLLNALTVLDVLVFSAVMPLALPVYLFGMFDRAGAGLADIFLASLLAMAIAELWMAFLIVPPPLLIWWPWWFVVNFLVLRPLRVVALLAELVFRISHFDPYIPASQRSRLA